MSVHILSSTTLGVTLVQTGPQRVAGEIVGRADRLVTQQVVGRLAVSKRQSPELRSEESGVLIDEAAAARFDRHIRRQAALSRAHQLRDRRTEVRIDHATIFRIASLNARHAGRMRVVLSTQVAHDSQVLRDLRAARHQLANLHSGDSGLD